MPTAIRFGDGKCVIEISACTSISSGRVPSTEATMAEPGAVLRCAISAAEGFGTSSRPSSCISKIATSLTGPKRFLYARTMR